jgi:hypothetical protein
MKNYIKDPNGLASLINSTFNMLHIFGQGGGPAGGDDSRMTNYTPLQIQKMDCKFRLDFRNATVLNIPDPAFLYGCLITINAYGAVAKNGTNVDISGGFPIQFFICTAIIQNGVPLAGNGYGTIYFRKATGNDS